MKETFKPVKQLKNKLVVHKPNELIEIVGQPITKQGLLAYNYLLHKFQNEKTDKLVISLTEIFNRLELSDKYKDIFDYLDSLQKIRVVSKDAKGKIWGGFNLLAEFKKIDDKVLIQIPNSIYVALCGTEKEKNLYYTTIKLLEQKTFDCVHSAIFYEIFKKYEKVNIPVFTVEDLKLMTGTTEKYKDYKDFKRYVLNKALEEINKYDSKYTYSYEETRLGRKVEKIQFFRDEKIIITNDDVELSSKMITAIKKAKKSIYIQKCFSEKALKKLLSKYDENLVIKALGECAKFNEEIKSFSALMIAQIEDIKKSKITEKIDIIEIFEDEKKQTLENDVVNNELEILKNRLLINSKKENKFNEFFESCVKACKNIEDVMFLAQNFKIKM